MNEGLYNFASKNVKSQVLLYTFEELLQKHYNILTINWLEK